MTATPNRASDAGPDILGEQCPGCGTTLKPGHTPKRCSHTGCEAMTCRNCEVRCGCGSTFCDSHASHVDDEQVCTVCAAITEALAADCRAFYRGGLD